MSEGSFFPEQKQSPFLSKEAHQELGLHVFGENFLPPSPGATCVTATDATSGQSDTQSREDHTHAIVVRIMDHDPVDADFTEPEQGMLVLNELAATMWIRGSVVWFSWSITPP